MGPEERIAHLREERNLDAAATMAIETFGPEVLGFLVTMLRNESDASEVFSEACEDLWRSLGRFDGRCSMRGWLYKLARTASSRFRRAPHRRPGRLVRLSDVAEPIERVRSETLQHLRTSVKDRFAMIRDSLEEDDRALLVLRVDRKLSWREITRTFSHDEESEESMHRLEGDSDNGFSALKRRSVRGRARRACLGASHDDG